MRTIRAYIDEKDVTTDWIDGVFDGLNVIQNGKQAVGFIDESPVYAYWYDNSIVWKCVDKDVTKEILIRLKRFEDPESDLFSMCYVLSKSVIQKFYFKCRE